MIKSVARIAVVRVRRLPVPRAVRKLLAPLPPPSPSSAPPSERCSKMTATKKIGHAVQRNRARRVMKAAIDEHLDYNIGGYDLIFVARGMTPKLKSWQLSSVVAKLFAQAGLPDKAKRPDAKPPATVPPARKQKPESRV